MITTKQRAYLRSLANSIESIMRIGKAGLTDAFLKQVEEALEKRELIKMNILENADLDAKEVQREICEKLKCEGVQVIGRRIVIYKKAEKTENRRIVLP